MLTTPAPAPMPEDDIAYYRELVSAWFAEDLTCLTWTNLQDFDIVMRAFGADPGSAESMNVEDAQIEQYGADIPGALPTLVAGTTGRWTLVVEPNGCEGTRPEVLRALAAHGLAVSVLLNGPRTDLLSYSEAGAPVVVHDLGVETRQEPAGLNAAHAVPVASTAGDEPLDRQAAALALAERITGERLTEEWLLDTNHVRLLVASPLADDIVPERYRDHPVLQDPEIRAIVSDPSPPMIRRIRYLLVRSVVQGCELRHPFVEEALEILSAGTDGSDALGRQIGVRQRVRALRDDLRRSPRAADALRLRAAEVVLHGLEDDLLESSRKVADHAFMGHFTDTQKAAVIILGNCLRHASP
ncbi:DUF6461 domain-containing protein [Microbispora bryophytorum]|uniref:Uncharacterized protein n=1 Tax=Microbispora bryophytorum subsp. camponoti TaxID=1677852 RepID=A0ABR8L597_9ACTN|nr:DUF6461 domain-containing protein [Microbispora camponoti]MBD3144857.1 hypothetical protein [Microbispora camponoti]